MNKSNNDGLDIDEVSGLTGLHPYTLRAWEKRYQVVSPKRVGTRRIYNSTEIERLNVLRDLVKTGVSIGKAARMSASEIREHLSIRATPLETQRLELIRKIENYQLEGVSELLLQLRLRLGAEEFLLNLVGPLLSDVGRWVESERLGVAQEHALSALIRDQIIRIRAKPARKDLPTLAFCTPEGDHHEFGILIASKIAESRGFPVLYFGINLPADALVDVVNACSPEKVIIGTTAISTNLRNFEPYLRRVKTRIRTSTELCVAGALAQRSKEKYVSFSSFEEFTKMLDDLLV